VFNLTLPYTTTPVTNQRSSGRCWLFASTNVVRYTVAQKLGVADFELSQVRRLHFFFEFNNGLRIDAQ
jgi:bleomycin hydrolase